MFDLEQYADSAEEIADTIVKISEAKKARAIIYARGYIPQAKIIMQLYELGIRNFILGKNLSDIRYQYAMCESGWYEEHGNEEITGTAKKPSEELPEKRIQKQHDYRGFWSVSSDWYNHTVFAVCKRFDVQRLQGLLYTNESNGLFKGISNRVVYM